MRTINLKSCSKQVAYFGSRLIAPKRFRKDEDGGATILTLYLLFIILLIASFDVVLKVESLSPPWITAI